MLESLEQARREVPRDDLSDPLTFHEIDYEDDATTESLIENIGVSKPISRRESVRHPKYQSLCPIKKRPVFFESLLDSSYEYRPHMYMEITCQKSYRRGESEFPSHQSINKVCESNNFACVQIEKKMQLSYRLKNSNSE